MAGRGDELRRGLGGRPPAEPAGDLRLAVLHVAVGQGGQQRGRVAAGAAADHRDVPALRAQPPVHAPDAQRRQGDGQPAARLVRAGLVGPKLHHAEIGQRLQGHRQRRTLVLGGTARRAGLGIPRRAGLVPLGARRGHVRVEQRIHPDRAAHRVQGGGHAIQVFGGQHDGERRVPGGQHVVGGARLDSTSSRCPASARPSASTSIRAATATRQAASNSAGISSRWVAAAIASAAAAAPPWSPPGPGRPIWPRHGRRAAAGPPARPRRVPPGAPAAPVGSRGSPPAARLGRLVTAGQVAPRLIGRAADSQVTALSSIAGWSGRPGVSRSPAAHPGRPPDPACSVVREFRREVATPAPYGLPGRSQISSAGSSCTRTAPGSFRALRTACAACSAAGQREPG